MSTDSVKEARGERKKRACNVERKILLSIPDSYLLHINFTILGYESVGNP